MFLSLRLGALGIVALCAAASVASADVVFTDGTFNSANYTANTPFESNISVTSSQCSSCGNPSQALQIIANTSNNNGSNYAQSFVNNTFSYNPGTQGAVLSISASVDKDITVTFPGTLGNSFHPVIEQGGNFYLASIVGTSLVTGPTGGTTGFETISGSGLTAASFVQFDFATDAFGTGNPNFDGGPMLFGLAQLLGTNGDGTLTFVYDNLSLDLSTVPEPTSLVVFGTALFGFGVIRRRRKSVQIRSRNSAVV